MLFTLFDLGARAELPVQRHPQGLGGLEKAHGAGKWAGHPRSCRLPGGHGLPVFCLGDTDLDSQSVSSDIESQ